MPGRDQPDQTARSAPSVRTTVDRPPPCATRAPPRPRRTAKLDSSAPSVVERASRSPAGATSKPLVAARHGAGRPRPPTPRLSLIEVTRVSASSPRITPARHTDGLPRATRRLLVRRPRGSQGNCRHQIRLGVVISAALSARDPPARQPFRPTCTDLRTAPIEGRPKPAEDAVPVIRACRARAGRNPCGSRRSTGVRPTLAPTNIDGASAIERHGYRAPALTVRGPLESARAGSSHDHGGGVAAKPINC